MRANAVCESQETSALAVLTSHPLCDHVSAAVSRPAKRGLDRDGALLSKRVCANVGTCCFKFPFVVCAATWKQSSSANAKQSSGSRRRSARGRLLTENANGRRR